MKQFRKIEPATVLTVGQRFKREVVVKTFQTEDGKTHEFTTWGKEGNQKAAVIAITQDKKVITTYQFRGGPEKFMYELPGGELTEGEDPKTGALRELKEETGYGARKIMYLGHISRDAYTNGVWHYFLALDCAISKDGKQLDKEEDEQGAEVRLISIKRLLENAVNDEMTEPVAVLMAYEKLKELAA